MDLKLSWICQIMLNCCLANQAGALANLALLPCRIGSYPSRVGFEGQQQAVIGILLQ